MNSKARLEVSGIRQGDDRSVKQRVRTEIATDQPFRRAIAAGFCNRGRVWPAHCRRYKEMNSLSEDETASQKPSRRGHGLGHKLAILLRSRGNKEESDSQFEQALEYELAAIAALEDLAALSAR